MTVANSTPNASEAAIGTKNAACMLRSASIGIRPAKVVNEVRTMGGTAAPRLQGGLAAYAGVFGIADSVRAGKSEMRLDIRPAVEGLGLRLEDLARQVRQAFYGEEAQRILRERDDVRVMVRFPREDRRSIGNLESMRIRLPDGEAVPFSQVALVEPGRGFASLLGFVALTGIVVKVSEQQGGSRGQRCRWKSSGTHDRGRPATPSGPHRTRQSPAATRRPAARRRRG